MRGCDVTGVSLPVALRLSQPVGDDGKHLGIPAQAAVASAHFDPSAARPGKNKVDSLFVRIKAPWKEPR
jgi:hypothetical protein